MTGVRWPAGLAPVLLVGALIGAASLWNQTDPACTRDVAETRTALDRSTRAVSAAGPDQGGLCAAYRQHVTVLEQAARVMLRCGTRQTAPHGAWPSLDAEAAFYGRRVAEACS